MKRLSDSNGSINTDKLLQDLQRKDQYIKGQPLSDDAITRVYQSLTNTEGKLSFEYIMKMGE